MSFIQNIIIKKIQSCIQKGDAEKALRKTDLLRLPQERHYYKGVCCFELGDLAKAQTHLESALAFDSNNAAVVHILAQVYMLQKQWDQALKVLSPYKTQPEAERIITMINKGAESRQEYLNYITLVRKAMSMLKAQKYEEAVACLKNALHYTEEKAKVFNQIGAVYFNYLKDHSKAEEFFCKAYQILPSDKEIKMNYAKAKLT